MAKMKSVKAQAFLKNEQVQQVLAAIMGAVIIGSGFLYWSAGDRIAPDFASIETEITLAQQEINRLQNASQLPDIYDQWQTAKHLAKGYGVEFRPLEPGSPLSLNAGISGGHVWQGILVGKPSKVLLAATHIQEHIPSAMGDLGLNNGDGIMVFGVIGSPPVKMNVNN